jgi:signal transduction histidine kinase/ActR/RegA family two-component response regulator
MRLRPGAIDIGTRAQFAALVPAILVAIALGWTFTSTRLADLEDELVERGFAIARQLAPASEYGVFSGNEDILRQLAGAAARETGVDGVVIADATGRTLAVAGRAITPLPPLPQSVARIRRDGADVFSAPVGRFQTAIDGLLDVAGEPDRRPIGHVVVQLSRNSLAEGRAQLVRAALIITGGGLAIALVLAQLLARRVTEPVLRVAAAVDRIGRGDLAARVPAGSEGVMGLLENGVNKMAASIEDGRANLERRIREATAELQTAKERAEAASRTKTQFLAAASHDLRQPLQALGLLISTLRLRSRDAEALKLVDRLEHAFGGLEGVLEALLDISKLDAGVVSPRAEVFPVERVLAGIRDTFGVQAAQKGLRLGVMPCRAWCTSDPLLLTRIVSNLVSNGLRYTAKGGVVVGCRRRGGRLDIEVWDTGSGIPESAREAIFREFVQLANPQRNRDQGLGLGLAIVDRLSRLLDHPVRLDSRVGRGTRFVVSVPLGQPPRAPAAVPEVATAAGNLEGMRILAIDDDVEVLAALETFLAGEGAAVIATTSESEARARLAAAPGTPDVIVSDYRLGGGTDGVAVVRALQAELGPVPAIILTGEAAPAVLRAIEASGLPRVAKPVRPAQLKAMLRQLVPEEG